MWLMLEVGCSLNSFVAAHGSNITCPYTRANLQESQVPEINEIDCMLDLEYMESAPLPVWEDKLEGYGTQSANSFEELEGTLSVAPACVGVPETCVLVSTGNISGPEGQRRMGNLETFGGDIHFPEETVNLVGTRTTVTVSDSTIIMEAELTAFTIMGKNFYEETHRTDPAALPLLLKSLLESCQYLETDSLENSLDVIRKEASKWVYQYMRVHNRKIAMHPEHVRNAPSDWRIKNPGQFYPSDSDLEFLATETGLTKKQVLHLFGNERNRTVKKYPDAATKLKRHFPREITLKLREWQTRNQGRIQPDPVSREKLLQATGLNHKQLADWFHNHELGRSRSKNLAGVAR